MAMARDLLKIYGLVFGNLLIILSVQFIIVAFTLNPEESGLSRDQSMQLLYPCIPVLMAGIILVAILLQRNTIPFYWVNQGQQTSRLPAQQAPPIQPPPQYPVQPRPGIPMGTRQQTRPRTQAPPMRPMERPLEQAQEPRKEPFQTSRPQRVEVPEDDRPNYLRYSRGLHYAPHYHGSRYYQPAHRDVPANIGPSINK